MSIPAKRPLYLLASSVRLWLCAGDEFPWRSQSCRADRWERERGLPRTPILALTASAVDEDVRRALEAGIDMHVSKPIRKAVLIGAIKKSIRAPVTDAIVKNSDDTAA